MAGTLDTRRGPCPGPREAPGLREPQTACPVPRHLQWDTWGTQTRETSPSAFTLSTALAGELCSGRQPSSVASVCDSRRRTAELCSPVSPLRPTPSLSWSLGVL